MEPLLQEVQCTALVKEVERALASENRSEHWKARMQEAYASGDVGRITRLLRPVTYDTA